MGFKDNKQRDWDVSVTVASVKRVRTELNVDLLDVEDGKVIKELIGDPILLVDVLYVVCKPQADERGVSDEDFGSSLAGDAIEKATEAFLKSLVAFFPSPKDRTAMERVMNATWDVMDRARDLVAQKLDENLDGIAEKALSDFEATSGSLLGLSASTQDP